MAYDQEKLQILKMVEDGKINHAEALELMDALGKDEIEVKLKSASTSSARMLRIKVREGVDKTKVNVNIPLSLVNVGLKIAKHINVGDNQELLNQIDMDEIVRLIEEGAQGKILEVEEEETNTTVEIYVD
jgi:hypothetical protein